MNKNDFWSIDRLLPKIHTHASFANSSHEQGASISDLDSRTYETQFNETITLRKSRVIRRYRLTTPNFPTDNRILGSSNAIFPEHFQPELCNLYSPSFRQLNEKQKETFFFFCHSISKRKKVQTSFSYLQLYLCRILRGLDLMVEIPEDVFWVWETYRDEFPLIDKLFSDFVLDLSLYLKTTPPWNRLGKIFTKENFTNRSFLINPYIFDELFEEDRIPTAAETDFILRMLTNCGFRNSKAYRVNKIFAAALEDALGKAFRGGLFNRKDLNDQLFQIQIPSEVRTVRRLFQGLSVKEIPEVEINMVYVPLLTDENIRSRCDEIIRYLDNRIRSILKMKNCLSRIHISQAHQSFLESILIQYQHLTPEESNGAVSPIPQKEPIIRPREIVISTEDANEIERASWEITQTLANYDAISSEDMITVGGEEIEDFNDQYGLEISAMEHSDAVIRSGEFWEFAALLSSQEDAFLRVSVNSDRDTARQWCTSQGIFFEATVAACNEKAQNSIDDAVFDPAGSIYSDYLNELKEVFPPFKGENEWNKK